MRIGILADVNLNVTDGSSLWVQSFSEAIARYTVHTPVILSRETLNPDSAIVDTLRKRKLAVLQPSELQGASPGRVETLLSSTDLGRLGLDVLLVRGLNAVLMAGELDPACSQLWGYITEFDNNIQVDPDLCRRLRAAVLGVDRCLVQTELARAVLAEMPGIPTAKLAIIPPMVSADYVSRLSARNRRRAILYAGKLAPDWGIRELYRLAKRLDCDEPTMPVAVYGGKVHDPTAEKTFTNELLAMKRDALVQWAGLKSRNEVVSELQNTRYCWAWRPKAFEERTLETSSKLLEACAAGCLPVCYPSAANRELLGDDYPLFARTVEEAHAAVTKLDADVVALVSVQTRALRSIYAHLDVVAVKRIFRSLLPHDLVAAAQEARSVANGKSKLLVAGHDLKFADAIIRDLRLAFDVSLERWRGHDDSERREHPVDPKTDVIWCEWCLGNAVYFSHNKHANQRLVIRFHLQEFETSFPDQVRIEAVDRIIFVNDHHKEMARERYGWPEEKLKTLPNCIEPNAYFGDKPTDAYYNIAMVGSVPSRKRLDRAIDLVERLCQNDDRWTLWVKGRRPSDYPWLRSRSDEVEYYKRCSEKIAASRVLRNSVRFVSEGADVPQFLRNMGWVLSCSDFESFHLAVLEGAASGAVPLVWPWDAACTIYQESWIVDSTAEAESYLLSCDRKAWISRSEEARCLVTSKFYASTVAAAFIQIIV